MARGRVITLETQGRNSGLARDVTIGFVEASGDALLIAASSDTTHWALNLLAQPRCSVDLAGVRSERQAVPLRADELHAAVVALILKYGTPAERLGAGPAFRLDRVAHTG